MLSMAVAKPLVAVVVVDREAREEGYAIEIDGWLVEDALPVDVAEGEVLKLVDPDGRTERMDVAAGEAWEVTGARGETWMALLDDEIRTDLLVVTGDPSAIRELAESLEAEVFEEDGKTYLAGKDVVLDAGWVDQELALQIEQASFVKVRARDDDAPEQPVDRAPLAARGAILPQVAPLAPVEEAPAPQQAVVAPAAAVATAVQPAVRVPVEQAAPEQPAQDDFPSDEVMAQLERYSGIHVCGNRVLVNMRPDGTWAFDGIVGYWHVSAPNVVRLQTFEGQTLYKAAFDDQVQCMAVWAPDSIDTHAGLQHGEKRKKRR